MTRQTLALADVIFELTGNLDGARDSSGGLILDHPHQRFSNPAG
jgi:hypothetical protein